MQEVYVYDDALKLLLLKSMIGEYMCGDGGGVQVGNVV